ncbi:lasso peptide biosynthesis PqqD family chaperone [Micromonospora sp. 050-3]|uniref:lasso peptide biosynthesis PqqD family chaperone n=1 Tax=Micromonospora sp. 050-3 TaxID=2789265 RepID=UPI00397B344A
MTLSLRRDVVLNEVDDGLVLLDERTGRYWHLNSTAEQMLRDLLAGHSPAETAHRLTAGSAGGPPVDDEFRNRVTADVQEFVNGLRRAKLVTS